ncbi:MAG TPA: ribulokinase [Cyclobacteriaceae bacterium]|nr:ribulokinase [Cyclobacteriaceae bacterium]
MSTYVIGLDFGTDSVRALLVDAHTGKEIGTSVSFYARWAKGLYCDPARSQYRQHPLDYIEGMEECLLNVLKENPEAIKFIKGISIDTTGSTPVAVNNEGKPLALLPAFESNPNAMFILWKDHTANEEAKEINSLAASWETDFTKYSGGIYSPEWFWAKMLHVLRTDKLVAENAFSWVEHCDWMPAVLTGNTNPLELKRSRCAAGHKAMWHEEFNGLPSSSFLEKLDPKLKGVRNHLFTETYTSDQAAGVISKAWAEKLGLPEDVVIGVGAIDAHFGAVGAAIEPYTLVKVMGTSTCDMLIAPIDIYRNHLVKGICGQVDGSIVPGMLGMEAGQSAFGDVYKWFEQLLAFPLNEILQGTLSAEEIKKVIDTILPKLNEQAALLPVTENDELAIDWINGRRTPDANMDLTGMISGLTLGSTAPRIFKALVEATAFGSKAIIMRFIEEGIPVKKVIVLGGISKKSKFVLQTLANVLNVEIGVVKSEQACALGAAMFAATASGIYKDIQQAQQAMSSGFDKTFTPEPAKVKIYEKLYDNYISLGLTAQR